MTPDDAAKLLAACAAFDNRQPSQIARRAWARALHDVPLDDDCFDAVARFYGTPPKDGQRLWIQPHDVRTHRAALRAERLANFVYTPPTGDTDPHYIQRLRGQQHAVGSGSIPAPTTAPALEGGPHPTVVEQLAAIGRPVPTEDGTTTEPRSIRRPGPLGRECPKCKAPIGRPCRLPDGDPRHTPHGARADDHHDPATAQAEEARRRAVSAAALNRQSGRSP
ncbi:hypothetical protein ACFYOF_16730 [Streptomyces sp. NPDC007148]|uniref:zinc finger domain-containing protein n=1 Tax=Streptomyces sp. NPDC007148 TaxID=3364775 RepID=UPI003673CE58